MSINRNNSRIRVKITLVAYDRRKGNTLKGEVNGLYSLMVYLNRDEFKVAEINCYQHVNIKKKLIKDCFVYF